MKKNNIKRGISLIVLAITIIVLIILTSVVVTISSNAINDAKKVSFANDITTVQTAVIEYYNTNGVLPTTTINSIDEYTLAAIKNVQTTTAKQNAFVLALTEKGDSATETFYVVDLSVIGISNISRGTGLDGTNDLFVVNDKGTNVYYPLGYTVSGTTYFTTTENLTGTKTVVPPTINDSQISIGTATDAITITKSPRTWSNNITLSISTNLDVGEELIYIIGGAEETLSSTVGPYSGTKTLSAITVDDLTSAQQSQFTTDKFVKVQKVNAGEEVLAETTMRTSNFDIVAPTAGTALSTATVEYNVVTVGSIVDTQSGVKELRYEYVSKYTSGGNVDYYDPQPTIDATYLLSTGKRAVGTIKLPKNVQKIKYIVVDNAGNASNITEVTIDAQYLEVAVVETESPLIEMVNAPNMKTGMIAVKWNGRAWAKADETNVNSDWYSYTEGANKWANAVTVKESGTQTRNYYESASIGTQIDEDDILSMWVWIPRFAYKINYYTTKYYITPSTDNEKTRYGDFDIKFLSGTTDVTALGETAVRTNTANTNFVVHPAFTAVTSNPDLGGSGEITGFWMGKFESSNLTNPKYNEGINTTTTSEALLNGSGDGINVTIRPSVGSWKTLDGGTLAQNMNNNGNIHGLGSDVDTMCIKNSQWGAVVYLTQSNYGNKQNGDPTSGVWNNSYSEEITYSGELYRKTLTGVAGEERDLFLQAYWTVGNDTKNIDSTESQGIISMSYYSFGTKLSPAKVFYLYHTAIGQRASTTGNIYGVYDMSGGLAEMTASYVTNKSETVFPLGVHNAMLPKYRQQYVLSTSAAANFAANNTTYGDAVRETTKGITKLSFNEENANYPYYDVSVPKNSFFFRGGAYYDAKGKPGIFSYSQYDYYTFRVVAI